MPAIEEKSTTEVANFLLASKMWSKIKLSEELGITRPTLDTRLSGQSYWKNLERKWLINLASIIKGN